MIAKMMNSDDNLLNHAKSIAEHELVRFKLSALHKERIKYNNRQKHEFLKYLISVATHPIGLRASVTPFNSSQEHMIAYLMDMFRLKQADLEAIIMTDAVNNPNQMPSPLIQEQIMRSKKRHSWRPELRIRLDSPKFSPEEVNKLDRLSVRVYLFKPDIREPICDQLKFNKNDSIRQKSRSILNSIFRKLQLDSSILIRPVDQMRSLLKFEPVHQSQLKKMKVVPYRMVQVVNDDVRLLDDLLLNIRRYYCDPETLYILRFEFWLEKSFNPRNLIDQYRNCVRQIVYNGFSACCMGERKSTYMNETQEFYGYTNIKLTQIPSYPIRQSFPILTLQGLKTNSCEIYIELRNRRLGVKALMNSKSNEDCILKHLRLYSCCFLYQCSTLRYERRKSDPIQSLENETTLDNLLYLPAHSLINQHRLQCNLTQLDDQAIRRILFLLLLIRLGNVEPTSSDHDVASSLLNILLSVIRNEYLIGRRLVNDKTMQEIDPFDNLNKISSIQGSTVRDLELKVLQEFVNNHLGSYLNCWLLRLNSRRIVDDGRAPILSHLQILRLAILHFRKTTFNRKETQEIAVLDSSVDKTLSKIAVNHLCARVEQVIDSLAEGKNEFEATGSTGEWELLLREIKFINHDICLYWFGKGLNGLLAKEGALIGRLSCLKKLHKRNHQKLLRNMVEDYLK